MSNFVVVVLGPTASGKSSLAVQLAKELNGEVISADSMQIYRGMSIATAQPTVEEMGGIPHHLIGFLDPSERFSVAKFKSLAEETIKDVLFRGKLPIVCGGTGLYIDALINNLEYLDVGDTDVRETLSIRAREESIDSLYKELSEIDPEAASSISPSNERRVIRALELYHSTGVTKSMQDKLSRANPSSYDFCLIGLTAQNRDHLYERVEKRIDSMLDSGLLDEAQRFFGSESSVTSVQAIGYKELKPYFDGLSSLDECVSNLKTATRHYVKRQLTWFRKNKDINWIFIDTDKDILDSALRVIRSSGGDYN